MLGRLNAIWLLIFPVMMLNLHCVVYGQLTIDTTLNEEYLVKEVLLGGGVKVGNIKFTGERHAFGKFTDDSQTIGIEEGIILTTGHVRFCPGPNDSANKGWASGNQGDEDLNNYTTGFTYDAAVLEFDFITSAENLEFNYVFASEEYLEYVGSKFNDVFGFFISGPGVSKINIANLPNTGIPITINNVNHLYNSQFYINNAYEDPVHEYIYDPRKQKLVKNKEFNKNPEIPSYNTQFDGFTVVLKAKYKVVPNEIYHIKIAIADVSDGILDSGVFLEAESFRSYGENVVAIDKIIPRNTTAVVQKLPKLQLDSNSSMIPKTKKISHISKSEPLKILPRFNNVEFEFDSYELSDTSIVYKVYQVLVNNSDLKVEIIGHTDYVGTEEYNMQLSKLRSLSAAEYLETKGISSEKIITTFFGESKPIDNNETESGRARNRRIEFVIRFN